MRFKAIACEKSNFLLLTFFKKKSFILLVTRATAAFHSINRRKNKMSDWHFQFNIDVDEPNSMVYVKIYGVWREDTARHYHEHFAREVKPLTDKPWARIVDLTNWKTATDDVVAAIGEHLVWCIQNNCAFAAYVIDNPITYGQLMRMIEKGNAKDTIKTFRTRHEAEKFLKENGFNISSSPDGKTIFK